jgi:SAM-dependent methyltransferase
MAETGGGGGGTVRVSVDVGMEPAAAFAALLEGLADGLARRGLRFEGGPQGRVLQGEAEVGRVLAWQPGERAALAWRPAPWRPGDVAEMELRAEPAQGGARLTLEQRGLDAVVGDAGELAGWFASEVASALVAATSPAALGDWVTDRQARRPSGARSRAVYRDPVYHRPNFAVILQELALTPADYLVEVGCGGGALLHDVLASGCRAAAVDHSPDMVRLAREANAGAVAAGRLEVAEASAERLPFPDDTFTCAAMTGVLGFLPDPVAVLAEMRRVLRNGGRLVVLGSDPELRDTPAAPEPMASRLRFYDDGELAALGRAAGLAAVQVVRRDLAPHARGVGIPEEHLVLFEGAGSRFLLARKG